MLFPKQTQKDNSPIDETVIVQVILYYDEQKALEFKELSKRGMAAMYPNNLPDANVSDFLLALLKKEYGTQNNAQKSND